MPDPVPVLSVRNDRKKIPNTNIFDKKLELKLPKIKNFKKPAPAWMSAIAGVLILALAVNLVAFTPTQFAAGAYTTSTTDADGNTHLGNNTVNDTYYYDTTQDSSQQTQQQLGIDPNWRQGVSRKSYALKYTATSNQYVSVPDASSLKPIALTAEAWFQTSSLAGATFPPILKKADGSAGYSLEVDNSTDTLKLWLYIAGVGWTGSPASAVLSENTWYHVAGTYDGNKIRLFINGVESGSGTTQAGAITHSTQTLGIGRDVTNSRYWDGLIDEVRISDNVRYTSAFSAPRRLTEDSNTVGLWHLDEGTGTAANDSSVYANNGTLGASTAAPTWVTGANAIMDGYDGANGYQNQSGAGNISLSDRSTRSDDAAYEVRGTGSNAFDFDGSDDYLDMDDGQSSTLDVTDTSDLTIEGWFYRDTSNTDDVLVAKKNTYSSGAGYMLFFYAPDDKLYFTIDDGVDLYEISTSSTFTATGWYHFAIVWDQDSATNSKIFINGTDATGIRSGTLGNVGDASNGLDFRIGSESDSGNPFDGKLDEIRVSNTVRYSTNFTPVRRYATDAATMGLWHLDEGTGTTSTSDASGNANTGTIGSAGGVDTNDPSWIEGVASTASSSSSQNWAMPNYAYRKRVNIATTTAIDAGHAVEATENRATILNNKQTRPDGKDWRTVYQPSDTTRAVQIGSGDYVNVSKSATLSGATKATVDFWMNPTATPSSTGIVFWEQTSTSNRARFNVTYNSANKIVFTWRDAAVDPAGTVKTFTSSGTAPLNTWTHIAVQFDSVADSHKIFINGQLDTTDTTASGALGTSATNGIKVGLDESGAEPYIGLVDELRVSDTTLYSGNFTPSSTPYTPDNNTKLLYRFDEGSGQITVDTSANQNHGTLGASSSVASDDPSWSTSGKVSTIQEIPRFIPHGHGLDFDGSADYVTIADNAVFDTSGYITLSAWIKPDSGTLNSASHRIISAQVSGGNVWYIRVNGNVAQTGFRDSNNTLQAVSGTTTLTANTWYHITGVLEKDKIGVYLNGVKEGSATFSPTGNFNLASTIDIGRLQEGATEYFDGIIDDARIYKRALSEKDIKDIYNTGGANTLNDIAGWWAFDDGSGQTVADLSGNSMSGTLGATGGSSTDDPTWVTNGGKVDSTNQTQFKTVAPVGAATTDKDYYLYYGAPNETGSAQSYNAYGLKFDGTDDTIQIADAASLDAQRPMTISAWIKRDAIGEVDFIFNKRSASGGGWYFGVNASNVVALGFYGIGDRTSTGTITDTNWHHIAATITTSGTNVTFYIDGAAAGTGTLSGATTDTTPLYMGVTLDSSGAITAYYDFDTDDARIYNRQLSATEIGSLYTNTPSVSNTSLALHFNFDNATAASASATDLSGNSNTGTLTNFNFNATSNWIVNKNLKAVATEPEQTTLATEQESPVFFEWQTAGSAWPSDRTQTFQLGTGEQQLGSTGVYVKFNPSGVYSRHDYYRITSWAIEAFSTSAPQRGRARAFPKYANLVATASGLDIIDASTNRVWMRYALGTSTILGATNAPQQVTAKNGRMYVASVNGLIEIRLDEDDAHTWTVSGNGSYAGKIADRNDASGYAAAANSAIVATTVNDVSVSVISNKNYISAATEDGMSVIHNSTQHDANVTAGTILNYSKNSGNAYRRTAVTSGGELYGINSSGSNLDRYDNVHSDSASQTISADASYSDGTTPALRNTTMFDLSVTEGTSTADSVSNTVAVTHNLGADVLQEHATTISGTIRYYARTGTVGASNWSSKNFGGAIELDGSSDYVAIPDSSSLDITSTFTLEAWTKLDALPSSGNMVRVIAKENVAAGATSNSYGFGVTSDGKLRFTIFDVVDITDDGSSTIAAGTWHHIAVSKSGTSYRFFIDGNLNSTQTSVSSPTANTATLLIGRRGDTAGPEYFDGMIDEVRISDSTRYTSTFTLTSAPFTADVNTMGVWHMDEATGQTVSDSGSSSNNGTLGANSSLSTDDPFLVSPAIAGASDKTTAIGLNKSGTSANWMWVGTNGSGSDDGAMTAISLSTDKQLTSYTSTASGLPDLDINSLSLGRGGLALVGTGAGAWNPGTAGIVVDDTAATPATTIAPVRSKSGTIRSKSGTVRVKGN